MAIDTDSTIDQIRTTFTAALTEVTNTATHAATIATECDGLSTHYAGLGIDISRAYTNGAIVARGMVAAATVHQEFLGERSNHLDRARSGGVQELRDATGKARGAARATRATLLADRSAIGELATILGNGQFPIPAGLGEASGTLEVAVGHLDTVGRVLSTFYYAVGQPPRM